MLIRWPIYHAATVPPPAPTTVPYRLAVRPRKLGLFADEAKLHDDFDRLPADMAAALGGDQP